MVSMVQRIEFSSSRDTNTTLPRLQTPTRDPRAGDPWERRDFTRETETARVQGWRASQTKVSVVFRMNQGDLAGRP